MPVLRWSPTTWRKMEALRDRILHGCGTDEDWHLEDPREVEAATGRVLVSAQWRKPLRIDEVNRMADTPEVRARLGRP